MTRNLSGLSKQVLLDQTTKLVAEERRLTAEILAHLREIERRRLYAELGFSSMFDYATKGLGYSESAALRRIDTMRLTRELPQVEEKITSGELSLSTASKVRRFIREMDKAGKKRAESSITLEDKAALLELVQGKSARECDRLLAELAPSPLPDERAKPISATHTEIRFVADQELIQMFDRIKELLGIFLSSCGPTMHLRRGR